MDDAFALDTRLPGMLSITTPLGEGVLVPVAVGAGGEEAVSKPGLVIADMVSSEWYPSMDALLHASVRVTLRRPARPTARIRQSIEAAEAAISLFKGSGSRPGMLPGRRLIVVSDVSGTSRDYVACSIVHQASDERPINERAPTHHRNSLTAYAAVLPWRQPLVTLRLRWDYTVLLSRQPMARMGDMTAHGGAPVVGMPTVLVGG